MKISCILILILLTGIVTNAQKWSKISAYWYTSVGIKDDGTLWGWGSNGSGFFLTGDYTIRAIPTQMGTDANWLDVSVGSQHILALKTNGTLWAWGSNSFGQLGDGTTITRNLPAQIGTATWLKVSAGQNTSLAIRSDSTLWAWGSNGSGQLGDGTTTDKNVLTQIGVGSKWKSVVTNYNHTLAIKADGTLWAWGENGFGQLGDGTNVQKKSPTQIGAGTLWNSLSESAAVQFSLAIASDGTLWGWGNNSYGQLGRGTTSGGVMSNPTQIGTATDWQKVATGSDHTLAIKTDGSLWAWGANYRGQSGDGTTIDKTIPTRIGVSTNWQTIATGQAHSLALQADSICRAWGYNGFGELGDGTKADSFIPIPLFILVKVNAEQTVIIAGGNATGTGGVSNYSIGQVSYIAATGSGGSENQGIQQSVIITTVGIDNFPEIKLQMVVYPNPTTSYVNLKIDASTELNMEQLAYQLADMNGKRIYNHQITDSETAINLENLPPAIYFLIVIDRNKPIKTFKIIKNN